MTESELLDLKIFVMKNWEMKTGDLMEAAVKHFGVNCRDEVAATISDLMVVR